MGYLGNAPYQGVLTGGNIQDGTVETTDLAEQAVTTTKLHDQAVTAGKLHTVLDLSDKTLTLPAAAVQAHAAVQSVAGRTGNVTLTKSDVGLSNAEDKSSATIRGEITSGNVTGALGYTPVNKAGDTMSGRLRVTGSGFSGTGLILNSGQGNERVAPEMYSLPLYTYYNGSTYLQNQVRIGTLARNGSSSLLHGRIVRHGDLNYSNQVIICEFFVHVWGAQDGNFMFFGSELARTGHTPSFASDASGNVYYRDGLQWEQQTYLQIYDMYNFTFNPIAQDYNSSLPWRGVSSNASTDYEVTMGT